MPRIKKLKHTLPDEVLHNIIEHSDTLLDIGSLEEFNLGDTVRTNNWYYGEGVLVGFVRTSSSGRVWCILKMQRSGGRYNNGYYVFLPSTLTKLS